ncbi:MAG: ornithine cyclodeaminase family protein [Asticcacaulis sp.]|uniref:ornithine cyclodeaminase family protein n=1 Tax=Asticcacaulis sp. TaxID=1872648 RepID=UPI003F7C1A68
MKSYSAADIIRLLTYDLMARELPKRLAQAVATPPRHVHTLAQDGEPDASLLLMPAWGREIGGVKIVNVTPGNAKRRLPAVTASYLLFDALTGEHLALLDGGELTARRTAAVAAMAADRLAPDGARRLLLIGSGRIASELAFAYRAVRSIDSVRVFSPTHANAEKLARALSAGGFDAAATEDLAASQDWADIIACATLSREPWVRGAGLRPGQHVALIGGYLPDMREGDDLVMRRGQVWVDTRAALGEAGDLSGPIASGALRPDALCGDLADLCAQGKQPGREGAITVFKSVGEAAQDLAAAGLVMNR